MKTLCLIATLVSAIAFGAESKMSPEEARAKLAEMKATEKLNRETLIQKLDTENKALFDDPKLDAAGNIAALSKRHVEYTKLTSSQEDRDLVILSLKRNCDRLQGNEKRVNDAKAEELRLKIESLKKRLNQ